MDSNFILLVNLSSLSWMSLCRQALHFFLSRISAKRPPFSVHTEYIPRPQSSKALKHIVNHTDVALKHIVNHTDVNSPIEFNKTLITTLISWWSVPQRMPEWKWGRVWYKAFIVMNLEQPYYAQVMKSCKVMQVILDDGLHGCTVHSPCEGTEMNSLVISIFASI